jgi:hypothetical protein
MRKNSALLESIEIHLMVTFGIHFLNHGKWYQSISKTVVCAGFLEVEVFVNLKGGVFYCSKLGNQKNIHW